MSAEARMRSTPPLSVIREQQHLSVTGKRRAVVLYVVRHVQRVQTQRHGGRSTTVHV